MASINGPIAANIADRCLEANHVALKDGNVPGRMRFRNPKTLDCVAPKVLHFNDRQYQMSQLSRLPFSRLPMLRATLFDNCDFA